MAKKGRNMGKKYTPDKNYLEMMRKAEFYNYDRIPGYNHHTGLIDLRYPTKRDTQVIDTVYVKLNIPE